MQQDSSSTVTGEPQGCTAAKGRQGPGRPAVTEPRRRGKTPAVGSAKRGDGGVAGASQTEGVKPRFEKARGSLRTCPGRECLKQLTELTLELAWAWCASSDGTPNCRDAHLWTVSSSLNFGKIVMHARSVGTVLLDPSPPLFMLCRFGFSVNDKEEAPESQTTVDATSLDCVLRLGPWQNRFARAVRRHGAPDQLAAVVHAVRARI